MKNCNPFFHVCSVIMMPFIISRKHEIPLKKSRVQIMCGTQSRNADTFYLQYKVLTLFNAINTT